jgi:hypothetical protein
MSSRNCESCLGTGEKPGIGHMPAYKCKKCAGTGIIHNFSAIVADHPMNKNDIKIIELSDPLLEMSKSEERRLEAQTAPKPKKRGRPAKNQ